MKKHYLTPLILLWTLSVFTPYYSYAQDLVTAVGSEGLEKTVSYDVARFTDIRDKKLEDVMKKMPGLNSMEWGGYTYNGMMVEKIYVNGLDVLEGNNDPVYNMKPEDVERLEITENHVNIKVMKGLQYSNNASINVVLKEHAGNKWSGSAKGGLGGTPLLVNADVNAINIGTKMQSTILFKADNTGLDFSGALNGFGGYDEWGMPADKSPGGIDYSIRQFLNVEPTLAPLQSDRVRFNRSGIANIGNTLKLNDDYQLNLQLTYHTDRLTAESLDETTYFLQGGEQVVDVTGENAKSHQHDIQADITLLANTDSKYLRNQLHFATRWNNVDKAITGSFPNDQRTNTTPLYVKDDFIYKRTLGKNILTLNLNTGIYSRPQDLDVTKTDGQFSQKIKALSAYAEAGATLDNRLNDRLTLSLNAGAAANHRTLDVKLNGLKSYQVSDIDARISVLNAFAGATLTYITDMMQVEIKAPLKWGNYNMKDRMTTGQDKQKSSLFFSPNLSAKYQASENLSLALEAYLTQNEPNRMRLYPHLIFNDFRSAASGFPSFLTSRNIYGTLSAQYSHPKSSVFINSSLSYWNDRYQYNEIMLFTDDFIISGFQEKVTKAHGWEIGGDISKGISSLKGKIGISFNGTLTYSSMTRNEDHIPYNSTSFMVSPYINGRLTAWWNVNYQLRFNTNRMKMDDEDTSSKSKSYTQTLEMIFSPWQKFNFSILAEHYYTEFMNDVSKHLVLWDAKAEYNISDNWQLILSARNLLNQKTYNFTLADSERFTKSYTAYQIRPRNILLSLFYKF